MKRPAMFLFLTLALVLPAFSDAPMHTYLTWQGDTSTTMTVNFQTTGKTKSSVVYFDSVSRDGKPKKYAHMVEGTSHQIANLKDGRYIHTVELTGLEPDSTYYFVAGDGKRGYTDERHFKTAPAGDEPIRFVTGGDMNILPMTRTLLGLAATHDPLFCLIGGDIAYANGDVEQFAKWDTWLDNWETQLVAEGGRMVPMVLAIGNHETNDLTGPPELVAPFYTGYFAQKAEPTRFVKTFGKNLLIMALDSGHVVTHEAQVPWMNEKFAANQGRKWKMAIYHVPLYPSHREYEGGGSVEGRQFWAPVFDKHGVTVAFENHDHTFKRTHLLYGNKVAEKGTLYLGDGCFGVGARTVDATPRWYTAVASGTPHFWVVDVTPEAVSYRAINAGGEPFDKAESR